MSRGASPIRVRHARGQAFRSQDGPAIHRRKMWRVVACAVLAAVLGYAYVWPYIQTNLVGYRLREVQLENAALRADIVRLKNQSAQLTAPARVDRVARNDLGLVRQHTWDLVLLPDPVLVEATALAPVPTFWQVQTTRWKRLGDRVHSTLGPGRALAADHDDALDARQVTHD